MAMVINNNIPALTTYNTINRTNAALEKSIQKLSTGLRINSAADDAAGLAISEKMRSQINGMDRAVSNAQDGISMIQTAEGALNETHDILQRMRELSVQAANDTLTSQDRSYIQLEIDELRDEVTRIGNTTQFNKKKLLNGDAAVLWSSDNLETKAIVNGGMRSIDQFGQKVVTEGNYKIKVKAEPGQGEVQKSDIFKIKHENVIMNENLIKEKGLSSVEIRDMPAGKYKLEGATAPTDPAATVTGAFGVGGTKSESKVKLAAQAGTDGTDSSKVGTIEVYLNGKKIGETANLNVTQASDTDAQKAALLAIKGNLIAGAAKQGVVIDDSFDGETITATVMNGTAPTKDAFEIKFTGDLNGVFADFDITTEQDPTDNAVKFADVMSMDAGSKLDKNASVLFEVLDVDSTNKSVKVRATADFISLEGTSSTETKEFTLVEGVDTPLTELMGVDDVKLTLQDGGAASLSKGSKWVYSFAGKGGDFGVGLSGTIDSTWPEGWGTGPLNNAEADPPEAATVTYGFKDPIAGKDIHLRNFYLNEKTGEVKEGDIILSTNDKFTQANVADGDFLGGFDATYVGKVAGGDVKLRDIDKFWTSEGVFMLNDPQTITLTQGDGKQTSVTLYGTDTLDDVKNKLNDAISQGLGQGKYVNDATKFVSFVDEVGDKDGSESVAGTFLIRTVIPGEAGAVSFSGDESIINAFSLNTIQNAKETTYTVSVEDAHDGTIIANDVKVTGNKLVGVIHPNVDVEFDALTGVSATWSNSKKAYTYSADLKETTLHLSDNTTVFQIGANEGEDMGVHIGDMRATALGIDRVNVTSRESASRSITILDNAIDKVSTQRAKLGAYQNRLEHTVNNLNTASENITAAESRIRDTDMAKEMMNFTKLQIMLQAGTSMLAQANQLPQNVMALVR